MSTKHHHCRRAASRGRRSPLAPPIETTRNAPPAQKLIISPRRRRHRPVPRRQEPFLGSRRRPNRTLNLNLNLNPPSSSRAEEETSRLERRSVDSFYFFVVEISKETKRSPAPSSQSRAGRAPRGAGALPLWIASAWRRVRRKARRVRRNGEFLKAALPL